MPRQPVYGQPISIDVLRVVRHAEVTSDYASRAAFVLDYSNILRPELLAARIAHRRLSLAEKVAVRLRYGHDVLSWWMDNREENESSTHD